MEKGDSALPEGAEAFVTKLSESLTTFLASTERHHAEAEPPETITATTACLDSSVAPISHNAASMNPMNMTPDPESHSRDDSATAEEPILQLNHGNIPPKAPEENSVIDLQPQESSEEVVVTSHLQRVTPVHESGSDPATGEPCRVERCLRENEEKCQTHALRAENENHSLVSAESRTSPLIGSNTQQLDDTGEQAITAGGSSEKLITGVTPLVQPFNLAGPFQLLQPDTSQSPESSLDNLMKNVMEKSERRENNPIEDQKQEIDKLTEARTVDIGPLSHPQEATIQVVPSEPKLSENATVPPPPPPHPARPVQYAGVLSTATAGDRTSPSLPISHLSSGERSGNEKKVEVNGVLGPTDPPNATSEAQKLVFSSHSVHFIGSEEDSSIQSRPMEVNDLSQSPEAAMHSPEDAIKAWQRLILRVLIDGPSFVQNIPYVPLGEIEDGPVSRLTSNFYLDVIGRLLFDLQKKSDELTEADDAAVLAISDNFDEIVRLRSSLNPSVYGRSKLAKMSKLEKLTALSKKRFSEQQAMIQDLTQQCNGLKTLHGEEIKRSTQMEQKISSLEDQISQSKQTIQTLEKKLRDSRLDYGDRNRYKVKQGVESNTDTFVELYDQQMNLTVFVPTESQLGSFDARMESVIIKREALERLQFDNLQLTQKLMCLKAEQDSKKESVAAHELEQKTSEETSKDVHDLQYTIQVKLEEQRQRLEAEGMEEIKHLKNTIKDLVSQNKTLKKGNELLSREIAAVKASVSTKTEQEEKPHKDMGGEGVNQNYTLTALLQEQLKQKEELISSLSAQIRLLEERAAQASEASTPIIEKPMTSPSTVSPGAESLSQRSQAEELILLQAKHEQLRQRYMELQELSGPDKASKEAAHQRIFLKNAMMKFIESDPIGSPEHEGLIPVIMRLLNLSGEEIRTLESKRPGHQRRSLAQRIQFWN